MSKPISKEVAAAREAKMANAVLTTKSTSLPHQQTTRSKSAFELNSMSKIPHQAHSFKKFEPKQAKIQICPIKTLNGLSGEKPIQFSLQQPLPVKNDIEVPLPKKPKVTESIVKNEPILMEEIIIPNTPLPVFDDEDNMFSPSQDSEKEKYQRAQLFDIDSFQSRTFKRNLAVWLTNWESHVSSTPCLSIVWASSGSGRTHYIKSVAEKMGFEIQDLGNMASNQMIEQILQPLAKRSKKTLVIWKIEECLKAPFEILGHKTSLKNLLRQDLFGTPKDWASGVKVMKQNADGQCYMEDLQTPWPNPIILITSDRYAGWVRDFSAKLVKDLSTNSFHGKEETAKASNTKLSNVPSFIFRLELPQPKELLSFAEWSSKKNNLLLETSSISLLCRKSNGNIYSLLKLLDIVKSKNNAFVKVLPSKVTRDIQSLELQCSWDDLSGDYSDQAEKEDYSPIEMDQAFHSRTITSPNELFVCLKKTNNWCNQEIFGSWEASSFDRWNTTVNSFSQRLIKSELMTCFTEKAKTKESSSRLWNNVMDHSEALSRHDALFSESRAWEIDSSKLHHLSVASSHLLQDSWSYQSDSKMSYISKSTWQNQSILQSSWSKSKGEVGLFWKNYLYNSLNVSLESDYLLMWIQQLCDKNTILNDSWKESRQFVWAKQLWTQFLIYVKKYILPSFLSTKIKGVINTKEYLEVKEKIFMASNRVGLVLYCSGISAQDILALQESYETKCKGVFGASAEAVDIVLLNNLKQCTHILSMISGFATGKITESTCVIFDDKDFGRNVKGAVQILREELKSIGIKKEDRNDMVISVMEDRLALRSERIHSSIFEDDDEEVK
jgi:hypothetical protein